MVVHVPIQKEEPSVHALPTMRERRVKHVRIERFAQDICIWHKLGFGWGSVLELHVSRLGRFSALLEGVQKQRIMLPFYHMQILFIASSNSSPLALLKVQLPVKDLTCTVSLPEEEDPNKRVSLHVAAVLFQNSWYKKKSPNEPGHGIYTCMFSSHMYKLPSTRVFIGVSCILLGMNYEMFSKHFFFRLSWT